MSDKRLEKLDRLKDKIRDRLRVCEDRLKEHQADTKTLDEYYTQLNVMLTGVGKELGGESCIPKAQIERANRQLEKLKQEVAKYREALSTKELVFQYFATVHNLLDADARHFEAMALYAQAEEIKKIVTSITEKAREQGYI